MDNKPFTAQEAAFNSEKNQMAAIVKKILIAGDAGKRKVIIPDMIFDGVIVALRDIGYSVMHDGEADKFEISW